jgi:hypothetical protein
MCFCLLTVPYNPLRMLAYTFCSYDLNLLSTADRAWAGMLHSRDPFWGEGERCENNCCRTYI